MHDEKQYPHIFNFEMSKRERKALTEALSVANQPQSEKTILDPASKDYVERWLWVIRKIPQKVREIVSFTSDHLIVLCDQNILTMLGRIKDLIRSAFPLVCVSVEVPKKV